MYRTAYQMIDKRFPLMKKQFSHPLGLYSLSGKTSYRKTSTEVSKPRDSCLDISDHSEIWQAPRQQCCRDAWQMSERYDHYNILCHGFETSRDLAVRRFAWPYVQIKCSPIIIWPMFWKTHNRYPSLCLWGRHMGVFLWVWSLVCTLPFWFLCYIKYRVIIGRIITEVDSTGGLVCHLNDKSWLFAFFM